MRTFGLVGILLAALLSGCAGTGSTSAPASAEQQRTALREMRDETLKQFYATKPEIEAEIAKAVGYGVFDGSQVNLVLFVGATGAGLLVDGRDKVETFMTLKRIGTGPGAGYKNYRQLIVFKDRTLFDTFRTVGADVGASADASLKVAGKGGAVLDGSVSFNPLISVYHYTESGALLQANWGGVAYLPDAKLNAR
jgi:lipid-binding SYLF domain-containing protein